MSTSPSRKPLAPWEQKMWRRYADAVGVAGALVAAWIVVMLTTIGGVVLALVVLSAFLIPRHYARKSLENEERRAYEAYLRSTPAIDEV